MSQPSVTSDEIAVAVAIDDRYVPHFATCVASIAASRGSETVRFFVVQGPTLSSTSVTSLRAFVRGLGMELDAVQLPPDIASAVPETRSYPPIVWHRLLIPDLLPDLDRAIVLDADLLVLQSMSPLYSCDMQGHALAAVGTEVAAAETERLSTLGVDPNRPYLNTGVMLMDLDAMRTEHIGPRALAWGHRRALELAFPEQDALNAITQGRWRRLHPRWNAMSHLWLERKRHDSTYTALDHDTARHSPAIVHFEGHPSVKPWCYRSIHPMRFLYRELRATTPWPLEALEGRSAAGAVLRRMPLGLQYTIAQAKRQVLGRGVTEAGRPAPGRGPER